MGASEGQSGDERPWFLKSSYAVSFPRHDALTMSQPDFERFLISSLGRQDTVDASSIAFTFTFTGAARQDATAGPFMKDLLAAEAEGRHIQMIASNPNDATPLAWNALKDIVYPHDDSPNRGMREALERAWAYDPPVTLRAIYRIRSNHLGPGARCIFYNAAGWLAQNHPLTLVANLQWLIRPVIEEKWLWTQSILKREKAPKTQEGDEDMDMVDAAAAATAAATADKDSNDATQFDVEDGRSHGYWKDLLNILVLAATGKFNGLSDSFEVFHKQVDRIKIQSITKRNKKRNKAFDKESVYREPRNHRERRHRRRIEDAADAEALDLNQDMPGTGAEAGQGAGHGAGQNGAIAMFESNALYRALHLTIARMFAKQLKSDLEALRGSDTQAKKSISRCGKWAPSHKRFHDRHTLIVTSIAEILYPRESLSSLFSSDDNDRETYLRYARESYRKDISALRKHLDVVERKVTSKDIASIDYHRLDVSALKKYTTLFVENDHDRFEQFIEGVAKEKMRTFQAKPFLPSLIKDVREFRQVYKYPMLGMTLRWCIAPKIRQLEAEAMGDQWRRLVAAAQQQHSQQHLEIFSSGIVVCATSSKMDYYTLEDGMTAGDAAIGLTLLIAEMTPPSFGSSYITFHPAPQLINFKPEDTFHDKVWSMLWSHHQTRENTNFVTLFEKLILPLAITNAVPPDKMIKRVFILCDKDFSSADSASYKMIPVNKRRGHRTKWSLSYERVKRAYEEAGYQMPQLVFWNLAATTVAVEKPDEAKLPGVRLIDGYSRAMFKRLLKRGTFDAPEGEEEDEDDDDDDAEVQKDKTKAKSLPGFMTPRSIIEGAMHKGFDMLRVLD